MSLEVNNIRLIFCAFLLSSLIAIEAHSTISKPDWIADQNLRYPEITYLTSLGFGDDRRSAKKSATAGLAHIFQSEIQSDLVLEQIEIAEYWFDPLAKVHYILTVLNRDEATTKFRRELFNLEREAGTWSERAIKSERPLLAVKALYRALKASRQADTYQHELRVIDPSHASPLEESAISADLQNRLNDLLKTHFQVEITLEGPHAAAVETTIIRSLNQLGFTIGPQADLSVAGVVRFEKTGPKSPVWHFVRWSTRITLTEKESGQIFGSIRSTGREAQLSPEEAEQESLAALQSEVHKMVKKRVSQYIFGE